MTRSICAAVTLVAATRARSTCARGVAGIAWYVLRLRTLCSRASRLISNPNAGFAYTGASSVSFRAAPTLTWFGDVPQRVAGARHHIYLLLRIRRGSRALSKELDIPLVVTWLHRFREMGW